MDFSLDKIIDLLKAGKITVIPTDTIYGIVGSALIPETVEEIYKLRKRSTDKPMIILISSLDDLDHFNIKLTKQQKEFLEKNWPNPLSTILSCANKRFIYLHRGTNNLAFRMPKDIRLLEILREVGPLVAPSANIEGDKPAENVSEAKKYFGNKVACYIDAGNIHATPSTLVEFKGNSINILRQGSYKV